MEIKKILNKWTILITIIGIMFIKWILDNPFGFGQIIDVGIFAGTIYILSLMHLFYFETLKEKFFVGLIDSLTIVIYLMIVSFDRYFLFVLSMGYVLPVIIITFLSYGLTLLWRRYKK